MIQYSDKFSRPFRCLWWLFYDFIGQIFNIYFILFVDKLQQQNQKLTTLKMAQSWEQFTKEYFLNSQNGILINPSYEVSSFNFQKLFNENKKIQQLQEQKQIDLFIQNFPNLDLQQPHNFEDLIIMHDYTITIVNTYLYKKRKILESQKGIKISKNLAEPLYISTKQLGIRYGIGINIFYNMVPLNDKYLNGDLTFGLDDFQLKFCLTNQPRQQLLFFGGAIIGSYYLARVIKEIFEINNIIETRPNAYNQINQKLQLCLKYWQRITQQNQKVLDEFQPQYFNNVLRPFLKGFTGIVLQGVDNGKDVIASTPGGSAGLDPTFQMFQAIIGLKSQSVYHDMQMNLRGGMPKEHVQCINYLQEKSLIRQYFKQARPQAKNMYNNIIKAYGQFLRIHSQFVIKFILNPLKQLNPEQTTQKGTGGTLIKTLIFRYQSVQAQKI